MIQSLIQSVIQSVIQIEIQIENQSVIQSVIQIEIQIVNCDSCPIHLRIYAETDVFSLVIYKEETFSIKYRAADAETNLAKGHINEDWLNKIIILLNKGFL